jgi:pimeloyl-ACP methyl ester carboxylesterase
LDNRQLDLLEAAGLTGADIVGNSVAGMLCAEVAALVPGFVRRLVLCDSYGIFDVQDPEILAATSSR